MQTSKLPYGVIDIVGNTITCRLKYRKDVSSHIALFLLKHNIQHNLHLGKTQDTFKIHFPNWEMFNQCKKIGIYCHINRLQQELIRLS